MKLVRESVFAPKTDEQRESSGKELFKDIDLWRKVIEPLNDPISKAVEKGNIRNTEEFLQFLKTTMEESGVWDFVAEQIDSDIEYYNNLDKKPEAPEDKAQEIFDEVDGYIWGGDVTINNVREWLKIFISDNPHLSMDEITIDDFGEYWDE